MYGKKAAEQIRKLFMHINSAETGDDVDIRIERDEFLQYCLDRARLGDEFASAEEIGNLKWYQDYYSEDYTIWKSGKPVPLRLDRFSFTLCQPTPRCWLFNPRFVVNEGKKPNLCCDGRVF